MATSGTVWHPYTQMKTAAQALVVKSAKGAYLELENDRQVLDLISSWWTNLHGHCHPHIVEALRKQAETLEHVIFAGFTHEPAEKLCRRLISHLPLGLNHVFFSDDGSTAVEVSMKMAYQYWLNKGISSRTRFLAFEGGYHGDTFGAMAIGASSGYFNSLKSTEQQVEFIDFPHSGITKVSQAEQEQMSLARLKQVISNAPEEFAAMIMEPLIQGAAGMRVCSIQFMQAVVKLCREAGILVIYDEVMTGFGRTGDWFAATKTRTIPDIICLSKGITGGFLPLAVTVASSDVYESFLSIEPRKMLPHGHSYTANPLACAAALASMDLMEENESKFQRLSLLHQYLVDMHWRRLPGLTNIRICGTIVAADLIGFGEPDYFNNFAPYLRAKFLENGLLVRPLGKTIYFMPPYCIEDQDLERAYGLTAKLIKNLEPGLADTISDAD
ncbi:MAG: adenosylmethionine--8-amino-7-oxononanoate transaminase [Candidatus Obscuribacter sp.]|nr:adenosylmethionine--8-amino-7-oxononanoate transaminase [Candidatus Obscuribacter sp.]